MAFAAERNIDGHQVDPTSRRVDHMSDLDLVISNISARSKFYFLNDDLFLFLLPFLLLFARSVEKLTVVHDPTNRWISIWRDFDQV